MATFLGDVTGQQVVQQAKAANTKNSAKTTSSAKSTTSNNGNNVLNNTATALTNALNNFANMTINQAAAANNASAAAAYYATNMSMQESALNRAFQQSSWEQTASYNSAEAEKNRQWQTEMSNTAYQRAVKDMKAAGINPILAYNQGGASVGSGSTASVGTLTGSMGSAQAYQAQQANMNNSLVMFGTIAVSALEVLQSLGKDIISILPKKWQKNLK